MSEAGAGAAAEPAKMSLHEVKAAIRTIAREWGADRNVRLSESAIRALQRKPASFVFQEQQDINLSELRKAIGILLSEARTTRRGGMAGIDITDAKRKSKCHYLWFC